MAIYIGLTNVTKSAYIGMNKFWFNICLLHSFNINNTPTLADLCCSLIVNVEKPQKKNDAHMKLIGKFQR